MFFKKKALYKYDMLEKYKIDIEKVISERETIIEKICESNNYIFYKFREKDATLSDLYIIRQNKDNKKKVVFFGNYEELVCVYKEHLFLTKKSGELNRFDYITCINVETGNVRKYKWKSQYGSLSVINGYGRFYNQDEVKKMYVKEEKLIMEIHREKTTSKEAESYEYNKDMDYILYIEKKGNDFVTKYSYEIN